jgi:cytochrome c
MKSVHGIPAVLAACIVLARPVAAGDAAAEHCGKGRELYMAKCSQCHGESGDGKGVGADFFNPRPRDFTSGAFKIRATESGELPTDRDIASIIRNGMPYTGMPAWPRFTDQEVSDLVCFVKSFNADFADAAAKPKAIGIPKAPAFSAGSAEKGKALYRENKCMDCHGAAGRGDGESAPTLKDDWGHPIRPADLTRRWTFRGGHRREDIYRTFTTGLNGTPMPSFASSIEEADRWHLVDYVYSLSRGDEPGYASMVTADSSPVALRAEKGREPFKAAKPALFPVVGQVIEGHREFFPAANAVEVRAVYDAENVAVLVSWHDMSAERQGANSPLERADSASAGAAAGGPGGGGPAAGEDQDPGSNRGNASDAVALQMPFKAVEGAAKPYFLFGDKKNPAEVRFADLAEGKVRAYVGKGRGNLAPLGGPEAIWSEYAEGEWSVLFLLPRKPEKGVALESGAFTPIAFSVWDGFGGETGDRRGVTSWYTLYLKPSASGKAYPAAAGKALAVIAAEALIVLWARRALRAKARA